MRRRSFINVTAGAAASLAIQPLAQSETPERKKLGSRSGKTLEQETNQ